MRQSLTKLAALMAVAGLFAATAQAQAPNKLTIGFLTDMSSVYSDLDGKNGALAVQMAIDDFGGKVNGMPLSC